MRSGLIELLEFEDGEKLEDDRVDSKLLYRSHFKSPALYTWGLRVESQLWSDTATQKSSGFVDLL